MHVRCRHYNWAGLHLALSDRQSLLRHLDIEDAGFAYRSDIRVPGAALRIDLNHHNISDISINRSEEIRVQVVYQSLFHKQSLMANSAISNTKSHGIHSLSPSLTLTNINATEIKTFEMASFTRVHGIKQTPLLATWPVLMSTIPFTSAQETIRFCLLAEFIILR